MDDVGNFLWFVCWALLTMALMIVLSVIVIHDLGSEWVRWERYLVMIAAWAVSAVTARKLML